MKNSLPEYFIEKRLMSEYTSVEVKNGELKMKVLSLGGIITNLYTPDKNGKSGDIVLWNN